MPKREQLLVFSLGYRAALADLIFGRTMVAAGVHFVERRIFPDLDSYLHGIIALDPTYLDVYRYADTLLNLSTIELPPENLRKARDIQELGLKQFPDNMDLWKSSGQFIAYLAPQRLPESESKKEWRAAGARILQHACDLSPSISDLPEICLHSSSLLTKNGEQAAAIQALERLIAIADDPSTRAQAMQRWQALVGKRAARKGNESLKRLSKLKNIDLPYTSRVSYQLMIPPFEPRKCQGRHLLPETQECATSFARWGELSARMRGEN